MISFSRVKFIFFEPPKLAMSQYISAVARKTTGFTTFDPYFNSTNVFEIRLRQRTKKSKQYADPNLDMFGTLLSAGLLPRDSTPTNFLTASNAQFS